MAKDDYAVSLEGRRGSSVISRSSISATQPGIFAGDDLAASSNDFVGEYSQIVAMQTETKVSELLSIARVAGSLVLCPAQDVLIVDELDFWPDHKRFHT